jgi:N4-gp56 family major capsid protein
MHPFSGSIDTDLHTDAKNCAGWQKVSEYAEPSKAVKDEVGALDYCRFLETSNGYWTDNTSNLSADTYYVMIFGEEAYGIVGLGQKEVEYIVHGYGSGGVGDALNQRMTSGWKAWHGCRILNDNYMHILKVTKSA